MADDADHAQAREERLREAALARVRRHARVQGGGTEACVDCGEPIPAERRDAVPGARTCILCQQLRERR